MTSVDLKNPGCKKLHISLTNNNKNEIANTPSEKASCLGPRSCGVVRRFVIIMKAATATIQMTREFCERFSED